MDQMPATTSIIVKTKNPDKIFALKPIIFLQPSYENLFLHLLISADGLKSPLEAVLSQETIVEYQGKIVLMSSKASLDDVTPAISSCRVIIAAIDHHF